MALPRLHPARRRPVRRRPLRRDTTAGFTLLQLLVYAAASGLTLTAAVASVVSSVRSNANLEVYQRVEERWGRLSYLIQSETTEASQVLFDQAFSCGGTTATSVFTLRVPYVSEAAGVQTENVALVHYYERGSGADVELRRCGPPYLADGRLDFAATPRDANIGLMTDLVISSPTAESFSFRMDLYTPANALVLSRTGSATVGVEPVDPG